MISNFLKYIQNNFAFSHRISRLDYLGFCLLLKIIIAKYHTRKLPFLNNPVWIFEYEAYEMGNMTSRVLKRGGSRGKYMMDSKA
jgi:uncharacterized membrane protein YhaH (DUF805 family)